MNLHELVSVCRWGTCITVASARNGRILIQNAMKSSGTILNLDITGMEPKIRISNDGNYGKAYLYCYAHEDEYKKLKENGQEKA